MQKLDIVGLIVVFLGVPWFMYFGMFKIYWLGGNWILLTFLQIGIGIGILVIPRIAKRKRKSNLEKRKNNQSVQPPKDSQNTDRLSTSPDSENDRKCRVCGTNISSNVKTCPGCGDIYS